MVLQLQAEIVGLPGLPGLNTTHWAATADPGEAASANTLYQQFWAELADNMHQDVQVLSTGVATEIDVATGQPTGTVPVPAWTVSGTTIADRLPAGTSGLIHLRTGRYIAGRELRGRIFVPAPCESANEPTGVPSQNYRDALAAAADIIEAGAIDPGVVVYSDTHNVAEDVALSTVSTRWARLSSRRT